MIEITILTGPDSGRRLSVGMLPCRFGKSPGLPGTFRGAGVWDEHFDLVPTDSGTPLVRALGDARVCVDSQLVLEVKVRDGLILEVGGIRLQVGIQPARHGSLVWREVLLWGTFGIVLLVQGWAMWWIGR
jgi:hypothetical protein